MKKVERAPVSIRFDRAMIVSVQRLACAGTLRRHGKAIVVDLVREAVIASYPMADGARPCHAFRGWVPISRG